MNIIITQICFQISNGSLVENISEDIPVRLISAFMEHLDLTKLGFKINTLKTKGRQAYDFRHFLKLFF